MLERKVPNRECFELGVSGLHTPFVLVVKLRQARGHLAASRPRGRHDNKRVRRFDVLVFAVPLVTDNQRQVMRITGNRIVFVRSHAESRQAPHEGIGCRLSVVLCNDDRSDEKAEIAEHINQTQHVIFVRNAVICTDFIFFDIGSRDGNNDFHVIFHLREHADFAIGLKTGKHARSVVVIEKFSAEFQVKLAAELVYAFFDVCRLGFNVLCVIKSDFSHGTFPFPNFAM